MDSLMVTHGLLQGSVPIIITVVKLSLIYFLLHVPFMVFHHIFVETMVLKIYLWLLGWKNILVVNSKAHISGGGKKTYILASVVILNCITEVSTTSALNGSGLMLQHRWEPLGQSIFKCLKCAMDWISTISTIFGFFIICFSTPSMC
jgi:hypothetical protein